MVRSCARVPNGTRTCRFDGEFLLGLLAIEPALTSIHGHPSGEAGIRTLGTLARTTVFETAPFNHSGTSPGT